MSSRRQLHVISTGLALASVFAFAALPRAQRGAPAPAPAQAAGALPKVSVGGLRVTAPGIGENGREEQPFNERPGTALVLYLHMAGGQGIIDIDDDKSVVKTFTDDKGANLLEEGRIGPFPKVTDDGSAALFEIEVRGRPSAGATSVNATGTVTVSLANGSKPTRVTGVRFEVGRTFKVGATTFTVKTVTANDETTDLEFGLPRSAMASIKGVSFFNAQGEPIESRRTGSGYMNDAGELDFNVKTKDKVATVEFDLWQSVRVVAVPFNVKVGLGLDK